MADVFVERRLSRKLDGFDICINKVESTGCLDLYRIEWIESFLGTNGDKLICHFRAPDAESVRVVFRNSGIQTDAIWAGTVHGSLQLHNSHIVVEHYFHDLIPSDSKQALQAVRSQRLTALGLQADRSILSTDRRRMVCICEAGSEIGNPPAGVWACRYMRAH